MSHVSVDELRTLFLFEKLDDDALDWLAAHGERRTYPAGGEVFRHDEAGGALYVLLEGAIRMLRPAGTEMVVVSESEQRGVYAGATRAYVEDNDQASYGATLLVTKPSSFFCLPAEHFSTFMHDRFPMAVHLLEGLYFGIRNSESAVRQREHLAQLGTLSAHLAHELNNPAAAAVRATGQLRSRVAGMRAKLAMIADQRIPAGSIGRLVELQETVVEMSAKNRGRARTSMETSDAEDLVADRLDELGVSGGYELAPIFVAAGVEVSWLDRVAEHAPEGELEGAVRWLAYTLESEQLMDEVEEATTRISALVGAVKAYSYRDAGASQEIDVHTGLDSTVVMLAHKLQGVHVVKDYARDLPQIPAYGSELNQVWTNLIDNAADAMHGSGVLTLRTGRDSDRLVVEVADDGPGIPPDVQGRIFDAFFTTKALGSGTGLGLENAKRIVERRHRGSLTVTTSSDGTTFRVALPLEQDLA